MEVPCATMSSSSKGHHSHGERSLGRWLYPFPSPRGLQTKSSMDHCLLAGLPVVTLAPPTKNFQHRSQKVNQVVSLLAQNTQMVFMSFRAEHQKPRELLKQIAGPTSRVCSAAALGQVLEICISNTLPKNQDTVDQGHSLRPLMMIKERFLQRPTRLYHGNLVSLPPHVISCYSFLHSAQNTLLLYLSLSRQSIHPPWSLSLAHPSFLSTVPPDSLIAHSSPLSSLCSKDSSRRALLSLPAAPAHFISPNILASPFLNLFFPQCYHQLTYFTYLLIHFFCLLTHQLVLNYKPCQDRELIYLENLSCSCCIPHLKEFLPHNSHSVFV